MQKPMNPLECVKTPEKTGFSAGWPGRLITSRSQVQILSPPLELTVAKLAYRRVIREAGVERRRPFCVLSPGLARTCGVVASLFLSISRRRATRVVQSGVVPWCHFRAKLSVVSLSRAAWVNGCCFCAIAWPATTMCSCSSMEGHLFRYFAQRPHSSRGYLPLSMDKPPDPVGCLGPADVVCHERLGGLLRCYERKAA